MTAFSNSNSNENSNKGIQTSRNLHFCSTVACASHYEVKQPSNPNTCGHQSELFSVWRRLAPSSWPLALLTPFSSRLHVSRLKKLDLPLLLLMYFICQRANFLFQAVHAILQICCVTSFKFCVVSIF